MPRPQTPPNQTKTDLIANEQAPNIESFFLDGLKSDHGGSHHSSSSPPPSITNASKGPDRASAGNGLVHANDDRCKPGVAVKVAFSFSMEDWALALNHKVGRLVDRSPLVSGSWRVKYPGVDELVECSVGLMGRYHLVYAEEDAFEDSPDTRRGNMACDSSQSVKTPSSPLSPFPRR